MNNSLMFGTGNNATGTPLDFYEKLNEQYGFGCDIAADKMLTLHENWYGPDHDDPSRRDCLSVDWPTDKPNFLNPPYGEPEAPCHPTRCKKKRCPKRGWHTPVYIPGCIDFVRKAYEQSLLGATTVLLLASRTDVEWFHEYIWDDDNFLPRDHIRQFNLLRGRLIFRRAGKPEPAPFPSLLAVFSK